MKTLEFYFDYASPYSYLASTQLEALAKRTGATIDWKLILLGAVFKANGDGRPSVMNSLARAQYLFKDLQDWAKHYGVPGIVLPESFPIEALKADRLGLVAQEHGKLLPWTKRVYRAAFVEGKVISNDSVLEELLRDVELDPKEAFARMQSPEIKDRLRKNTEEAMERGTFGAPTFFIGDQMFFGNDRLHFVEQALK